MPRLRTQNITISGIDTQEHQTPFDSSNRHTKVVQRWQELGIPVRKPVETKDLNTKTYDTGALFQNVNKGINLKTLPRTEVKRLVKRAQKHHSSFIAAQKMHRRLVYDQATLTKFTTLSSNYLGLVEDTQKMHKVQANGGLAYHPHGALSLFNTPNGPLERQLIARMINTKNNNAIVGLGGVVSTLRDDFQSRHLRTDGRAGTIKVYQTRAAFDQDGKMELNLDTKVPEVFDKSKGSTGIAYRDVIQGWDNPGYTDLDMEDEIIIAKSSKSTAARVASNFDRLVKSSPVYVKGQDGSQR